MSLLINDTFPGSSLGSWWTDQSSGRMTVSGGYLNVGTAQAGDNISYFLGVPGGGSNTSDTLRRQFSFSAKEGSISAPAKFGIMAYCYYTETFPPTKPLLKLGIYFTPGGIEVWMGASVPINQIRIPLASVQTSDSYIRIRYNGGQYLYCESSADEIAWTVRYAFDLNYGGATRYYSYPTYLEVVDGISPVWSISGTTHIYTFDNTSHRLYDTGTGTARNLTGSNTPTYGTGILGDCMILNGTNQDAYFADNTDFEVGTGDFTVCGWIYPTSVQWMSVFSKSGSTDPNNRFEASIRVTGASSIGLTFYGGTGAYYGTVPVTPNAWNFFWIRRSSVLPWQYGIQAIQFGCVPASYGMFLTTNDPNNTMVIGNTITESMGVNGAQFIIGQTSAQGYYFAGSIDQFIFCKGTAFTDDQLAALYNAGVGTTSMSGTATATISPVKLWIPKSRIIAY